MEEKSNNTPQDRKSGPAGSAPTGVTTTAVSDPSESSAQSDPLDAKTVPIVADDMAAGFVGRWNKLVSTTNWEKGRIICEWREALLAAGQPVTDYSDEAWAQLVGHVTSQHVGRLRRVYQRFEADYANYQDLFWSHFQAALDWSDAEMWLEGAIRGDWSVSQMRGQRWEAMGTPEDEQAEQATLDAAVEKETLDEDGADPVSEADQPNHSSQSNAESPSDSANASQTAQVNSEGEDQTADESQEQSSSELSVQATARQRLGVVCDDLPDDIAEAFEQFKLAIIAQRREGWQSISREGIIECLDALKELVGTDADSRV
ncbi:MAG: hypothetical protein ABGX16_00920 [Pirellulales bacterium]